MEAIILGLLVLAVALLIYVIAKGKKEKSNVLHNEDPLAGLPHIIGKPKDASNDSSPSTTAQSKRESTLSKTDNLDKRNEGTPKVYKIPQEVIDEAIGLPDWKEEEEELERYAASSTEEGFATGVTFDELATVGKMLECQALEPSEEKTAADIVSKIDGTELLGLLESRIGDVSRRIAMLLDMQLITRSGLGSSSVRNDSEESFNIHDYT